MADTQIFSGSVEDAPKTYRLPSGVEFILKAVNADYADNGAASDWLPCVTIVSDSGHVIARAVDQAVKVTAGSDAEVSWFRGVKHFAAAAPSGGAPDTVRLFGVNLPIPVTAGGFSGEAPWDNTTKVVTGTNIWTYTLDGAGHVVEVLASAAGLYEMWSSGVFAAPSKLVSESLVANVFGTIPLADQISNTARNETTTRWAANTGLLTSFASGTAQFSAEVDFSNNASGNFTGDEWWIKHWTI